MPTDTASNTDSSNELLQSLLNKVDNLTGVLADTRQELKRSKAKPQLTFKRKGHKVQHECNSTAIDYLTAAGECCARGEVEKATENISEGIDFLENRNKLILIADTSECGWDTVDYFQKPDIFDTEAEFTKFKTAASLAKADKKKKLEGRKKPFFKNKFNPLGVGLNMQPMFPMQQNVLPVPSLGPGNLLSSTPFSQPANIPQFGGNGFTSSPGARGHTSMVQCYACYGWGHVAAKCPFKVSKVNDK